MIYSFLSHGLSATALIYSVVLCAFRHSTCEHISAQDSLVELLIHSSVLVTSFCLISDHPFGQAMICLLSIALMWHSYWKYVGGVKYDTQDLEGKVYIVTGCNTGIIYYLSTLLRFKGEKCIKICVFHV